MVLKTSGVMMVILLFVPGVHCEEWAVTYHKQSICALKGTSVDFPCTYTYPRNLKVQKTFWFIYRYYSWQSDDLYKNPQYSQRVQYLGNKEHDCTFRINHLRESDSATYRFRFQTDKTEGRYTGAPGVTLTVRALQVSVNPDTVTEGQRVTLTCSTICTLSGSPAFIWYKNGHPISNSNQILQFSASSEDAGSYSCAVKGYEDFPSPVMTLNVKYSPKNTSVSVSPSGEIVEGSSVTLTCSSNANPPVQRYTWFKKSGYQNLWEGNGQTYTIKDVKYWDVREYCCEAQNNIGTGRSPYLHLKVQCLKLEIDPDTVREGDSVKLTCSTTCSLRYSPTFVWYKNKHPLSNAKQSLQLLASSEDTGSYSCGLKYYKDRRSSAVTLNVRYAPKNTSLSVSPSSEIVEGSSVILTCSSNANPPVQRYTWFKKNQHELLKTGEVQTYTITHVSESHAGVYYCEAQNDVGKGQSPHLQLKVQCAKLKIDPDTVTEGQRVTLTCSTTCTLSGSPAFIWYKNGLPLSNRNQNLDFSASSEDAGSYSCAVTSYKDLPSSAVTLDVRYAPKNTSVSVSPTAEIVKGSPVTLTCSSNANPPVRSYNWFKDNSGLSLYVSQQTYTIRNADSWHIGEYYCEAQNSIGTHRSPHLHLKVQCAKLNIDPDTVTEGQRVTLTCSATCYSYNPDFIWYKNGNPLSNTNQNLQFSASSEAAGSYSCSVRGYEEFPSSALTLNVKYSPKSTSVSVSPSGEIVEGSSVTLTCSCNANPPVQSYTWFKNNRGVTSVRGSAQNYSITNITSEDSGQYYCEAKNNLGSVNSTAVSIDVQYGPKSASVSVSPSGEIVEDSSVTLTCSCNANPPVQSYTWFKNNRGVTSVRGSAQIYSITNIRSEDSGQYYCEAKNNLGSVNSTAVSIDVQYGPKNASVSLSPSGEIVEGSSVTLTCSSNANPPVQSYTWFKKNKTGVWQTGSLQNLTLSNIRSWNSGQYYCEAKNNIRAHNSTAQLISLQGNNTAILSIIGVPVLVAVVLLLVIVWMRRRNSAKQTEQTEVDKVENESPVYSNMSGMALTHNATQSTGSGNEEIELYSTVTAPHPRNQEEVLYSTVQPAHPENEDDVQYASIRFPHSTAATRSPEQRKEDDSVIYSNVSKGKT